MLLACLVALALGWTFICLKTKFPLLKMLSGLCWWVLAMYIKSHAPYPLVEGDSVHTMIFIVLLGMGLAIPIVALWSETRRTHRNSGGFDVSEDVGGWHLPDWMSGGKERERREQQKRIDDNDNYRANFRRAIRGPGKYRD